MSLVHSLKWSFLAEFASKAITPIVFIVLARLLTPEDFGVMSAAMMVIAFSQIFWEAGMGKALIQRQTDVEDAANVAFWVNLGLGLVIAILLFWGARPIAQIFFHDERVKAVLQVMTLQVFFGALSSAQTALLQKQMGFQRLFWVRLATVSLPGIASIPLGWNGMGYWALVTGSLVGQIAQSAVLWSSVSWRPKLAFRPRIFMEMFLFSRWVIISAILGWFFLWFDTLVVGHFFSTSEIGIYRVANQIPTLIFSFFFGFASPVLYSKFSSINSDSSLVKSHLLTLFKLNSVVALSLGVLMTGLAGEFENILGIKWNGIGIIVTLISMKEAVLYVFVYYQEAVRAIGKPKLETLSAAISVAIHAIVLPISASYGFDAFIYGRALIVGALCFILHYSIVLYVFRDAGNVFFKRILFHIALWLSVTSYIAIYCRNHPDLHMVVLSVSIAICFALYMVVSEWRAIRGALFYFQPRG